MTQRLLINPLESKVDFFWILTQYNQIKSTNIFSIVIQNDYIATNKVKCCSEKVQTKFITPLFQSMAM